MKVVSYSDLRQNLSNYLDGVTNDHEAVLVTRKNNQTAVLLSLDDFNAFQETGYLLSSPANAARLKESIEQLNAGKTVERELIEE